jgi:putative ABC transport system substrate-binding protein
MKVNSSEQVSDCRCDNLKSKIAKRPRRRKWMGLFAIIVALMTWGARAEAQQPKKVTRIGYLSPSDPATDSTRSESIRRALRERGYLEGQNIATEYRYGEGKRDRYPELASDWCVSRLISSW